MSKSRHYTGTDGTWIYKDDDVRSPNLILFVHGFRGDADQTWQRFPELLLQEGQGFSQDYEIASFGYRTGVLGNWERLETLTGRLRTFILAQSTDRQNIYFITHSLGGLLTTRYLVDCHQRGETDGPFERVRQVHYIGVPHAGVGPGGGVIASLLKPVNHLAWSLRKQSPELAGALKEWRRIADLRLKQLEPLPRLFSYVGSKDWVAPDAPHPFDLPACTESQEIIAGDHIDIVKPVTLENDAYRLITKTIKDPPIPAPKCVLPPIPPGKTVIERLFAALRSLPAIGGLALTALGAAILAYSQTHDKSSLLSPGAISPPPAIPPSVDRPILFMADPNGSGQEDVYQVQYDLSKPISPITLNALSGLKGHVDSADWAPDGEHIAFVADHEGDPEVYVTDPPDSPAKKLSSTGEGRKFVQWAPDSKSLIMEWVEQTTDNATKASLRSVYQVFMDGSGMKAIVDPAKPIWNTVWGPYGDRILYSKRLHSLDSNDPGPSTLFIMDIATRTEHVLRPTNNWEQAASWSPTSDSVAFSSNQQGVNHLIVLDIAKGSEKSLLIHNADDQAPIWSPDGKRLAVLVDNGSGGQRVEGEILRDRYDLWTIAQDGASALRLTDNSVYDGWVRWSPDGQWLVFERAESQGPDAKTQIWVIRADGTNEHKLTVHGGARPSWGR